MALPFKAGERGVKHKQKKQLIIKIFYKKEIKPNLKIHGQCCRGKQ